ncbi:endonuclease III domain-containing protein [Chloroflexota bacterium]
MLDSGKTGEQLQAIYNKLLETYGPQHWWPGEEPFEVMVGAILTQSTAWLNVEKAINNLKTAGILSPQELRRLSQSEVATLIYPSGYYNVKAAKLKTMVEWLGEYAQDDPETLSTVDTDELRRHLLAVWGIGEETADSIIIFTLNTFCFWHYEVRHNATSLSRLSRVVLNYCFTVKFGTNLIRGGRRYSLTNQPLPVQV